MTGLEDLRMSEYDQHVLKSSTEYINIFIELVCGMLSHTSA
jgi:hypothetical protein